MARRYTGHLVSRLNEITMVPAAGLEPALPWGKRILSPISTCSRIISEHPYTADFRALQRKTVDSVFSLCPVFSVHDYTGITHAQIGRKPVTTMSWFSTEQAPSNRYSRPSG